MTTGHDVFDGVLEELIGQLPTMTVEKITLTPADPAIGEGVTARIDVAGRRRILCEITGDGRLQSARVIES